MDKGLFDSVNKAAYLIWETTGHKNALDIWYCTEDIGCYLERYSITSISEFERIVALQDVDPEYINLIRNIAFRIYIYTNIKNTMKNWIVAEILAKNYEWVEAITVVAQFYKNSKISCDFTDNVRSETVKKYYYPFTQKF